MFLNLGMIGKSLHRIDCFDSREVGALAAATFEIVESSRVVGCCAGWFGLGLVFVEAGSAAAMVLELATAFTVVFSVGAACVVVFFTAAAFFAGAFLPDVEALDACFFAVFFFATFFVTFFLAVVFFATFFFVAFFTGACFSFTGFTPESSCSAITLLLKRKCLGKKKNRITAIGPAIPQH